MSPLAQLVAAAVYQNSPHVLCFTCLAAQQALNEHDIRAVALVLIVRASLQLVQRVCSLCQRTDEALVSQKVTAASPGTNGSNGTPDARWRMSDDGSHRRPSTKDSGS